MIHRLLAWSFRFDRGGEKQGRGRAAGRALRRHRTCAVERLEDRQLLSAATVTAAVTGLGVIGDSLSDEYAEAIPTFEYLPTSSRNWVELMAQSGKANFGAWKDGMSEPRLDGYEFDWARYGASSATAISQGQLDGVAAQVRQGVVSHVAVFIGQNDFSFGGDAYKAIYSGKWTTAQIKAKADAVLANLSTILKTVRDAGGQLVVSNIIDWGVAPIARATNRSVAGRDRVAAVIYKLNQQIATLASQYGAPLIDLFGFTKAGLGTNAKPITSARIGGQTFYNRGGFDVRSEFIFDGAHPSTVGQAQIANLFITALDRGYGQTIPLFSEKDIVKLVGLSYKKDTANIPYAKFVVLPTTILSAAASVLAASASVTASAQVTATVQTSLAGADVQRTDLAPAAQARTAALLSLLAEQTARRAGAGQLSSGLAASTLETSDGKKIAVILLDGFDRVA